MGNTHKRYAPEYRQRMVELVRADATPKSSPASSRPPRSRFATGWLRPTATRAGAAMDLPPRSARSLAGCGARIASWAKRARSCQKPRPGSRRRPARGRHRVPIRECESGQLWDRACELPQLRFFPPSLSMTIGFVSEAIEVNDLWRIDGIILYQQQRLTRATG